MSDDRTLANSAVDGQTIAELAGTALSLLWQRKVLFIIVGILTFIISASVSFLLPEVFVARTSILPATNSGGLSSMLSRFGSLPMVSELGLGSNSTQLYPAIAKSEFVIGNILKSEFEGQTVLSFLNKEQATDSLTVHLVKSEFRNAISTNINLRNDIVTIEYGHKNRYFAAFIVNAVVGNMETYLSSNSHNEIMQQMETINVRLLEVTANLDKSEKKLLEFWNRNTSVTQSPKLRIAEKALLREQQIDTSLYVELVKQRELLKIQTAGKAPILTVLDYANVPMVRASPDRIKIVAVSMMLVFVGLLAYLMLNGGKANKSTTVAKD